MKIYLVGGAVRDNLLGLPHQEKDYVVVGAKVEDMLKLGYRQVGKDFPVFLHPKTNEEYALARMERKTAPGYQGFAFDTSQQVTLEEDLIRRDLTINAMAMSEQQELIDPYGGKRDLEAKLLRHVSPAFAEDPVRILRIGRFLARFYHLGFRIAPETQALMREMTEAGEVNALVAERVWKELERALSERHPEMFFQVLADCGALTVLFPTITMTGAGMQALMAAAKNEYDPIIKFAALLHDSKNRREDINALANRYRIPNAYHELAKLVALHYQSVLNCQQLSAAELLALFTALDIFRREDRFAQFLLASQAIADAKKQTLSLEWIKDCANHVKAASSETVKQCLEQGADGKLIAEKLQQSRLNAIELFLS